MKRLLGLAGVLCAIVFTLAPRAEAQTKSDTVGRSGELVVIDSSVAAFEELRDTFGSSHLAHREVVLLDAAEEPLESLSRLLAERSDLRAVHIVSHGRPGVLELAGTSIDDAYLRERADMVRAWRTALREDADILLYGCEIGQIDELARVMAALTGANVAASTDVTGHGTLGGNWALETSIGGVTTAGLAAPRWTGTLANVVQTFFLPMPETQVRTSLLALQSGTGSTMDAVTSIIVTGNNTLIYYDHWEDGYEVDIETPTQSTTAIWGDNNPANGFPPGHPSDVLSAGDVISLRNLVSLPRNPGSVLYDGRDRVAATRALAVSRASWATSPGAVLAGAVEVSSVRDFGTSFRVPVGQNVSANNMFQYVSLFVMAADNGTSVQIDVDGNGSTDISTTLNRGESYHVPSGVMRGATVVASKPVQAHIITGHIGANYESRWYTMYPVDDWSDSYFTPVGSASNGNQTYIFVYNPGGSDLAINFETQVSAGSFVVPANGTHQFLMPTNSGAEFFSSGDPFFAVATVGARPTSNNVHDWGFSLVPSSNLTTQAVVGWGPGSSDLSANGSPVWVMATRATTAYVDYDGDPTTGPLTDINGDRYDVAVNLANLESRRIFDPDRDQTGMKLYTLDGALITAAWGQDPATAGSGNPFLDLGTTVLPLPVPIITKESTLVVDDGFAVPPGGGNGLINWGDTLEYTIRVSNEGIIVLGNVLVLDAPPPSLTYVPSSTSVDGVPIPDDLVGSTLFVLDETGYVIPIVEPDGYVEFKYRTTVNVGATSVVNAATADGGGTPVTDEEVVPVDNPGATSCGLSFTDSGGTGVGFYIVGQSLYATVTDGDQNTNPLAQEFLDVLIINSTTLDAETVTLAETGVNSGVFRNTLGLPFSASSGLSSQDGTLYALIGDSITASHTDPVYGDQCEDSAAISPETETKHLYLSTDGSGSPDQDLDRVHPGLVSPVDGTTATSVALGLTNETVRDTFQSGTTYSQNWGTQNWSANWTEVSDSGSSQSATAGMWRVRNNNIGVSGTYLSFGRAGPGSGDAPQNKQVYRQANLTGATTATLTFDYRRVVGSSNANHGVRVEISGNGGSSWTTLATYFWTGSDGAWVPASFDVTGQIASNTRVRFIGVGTGTPNASNRLFFDNIQIGYSGGGSASTTFSMTPAMAGTLSMPVGGAVTISACIDETSGTLPATADVTATLRRNATPFFTDTTAARTASDVVNCDGGTSLSWSGTLSGAVAVAATEVIHLDVTTTEAGVTFEIEYDSNTKASQIALPTTTVINVDSVAVFDAAHPGGGILGSGNNGQPYYIRVQVSDPFGAYDITSLALAIDGPGAACDGNVEPVSVVNAAGATKVFEYVWATGACEGNYDLSVTAREGYEGTIVGTGAITFPLTALDLGTPCASAFDQATYSIGNTVVVQITDLDQNTNPSVAETLSVAIATSNGDSETRILTETGLDSGVFAVSTPSDGLAVATGNGVLNLAAGAVLTLSYVDPDDPSDTCGGSATVLSGSPTSVAIAKTRAMPADGVAVIGETVRFDITVTNTGGNPLPVVNVTDTFPTGCLTFVSASITPTNVTPPTITWDGTGNLGSGQSRTIQVFFTAGAGTCTPGSNSASVSGTASAGPATDVITVTRPEIAVTKSLSTSSPAEVGSIATFTVEVTNTGTTAIETLPLQDDYSTCLSFVSSVPAADSAGGGSAVWSDLLAGPATLLPGADISITTNFLVVGACNPAGNTADVSFAEDIFGDQVPPRSATDSVTTIAATISGQVRHDVDGDGDFTDADTGISGATVRLFTDPNEDGDPSDGALVDLVTTDSTGHYTFINLGTENYVVVQQDLPAFYSTADTFGLNDNRIPVAIATVTDVPANDFLDSQFEAAAVNGRVYHDVDGNGLYAHGTDTPQSSVAVTITDVNGLLYVVNTNSLGLFSQAVPPGLAKVDVDESTLVFMNGPTLTTDASGEGNDYTVVFAPQGGTATDNTGYVQSPERGTVDGTIYQDVDIDGLYTPGTDIPLSGVELRITDVNSGVYAVLTDANGYFSQVVPAGASSVDVVDATLPSGSSLTTDVNGQGSDPTAILVPNGGAVTDNTGYLMPFGTGLVDGTVFVDQDDSGTLNAGDPALPGLQVQITDSLGGIYIVTTNPSGYFQWPVPPGDTLVDIVDITLPPRATLTTNASNQGSDATLVLVPIHGVDTDNTGYVLSSELGFVEGVVYLDVDLDEVYTPGTDTPLTGIEIAITDVNDGEYTVFTNLDGEYSQLVPPGDTTVDVVDTTLPSEAILAPGAGNTDPTTVTVGANGVATDDTGYILVPHTPTPTPTNTPTETPTSTSTATATATATATDTSTPEPTFTNTPVPTDTHTPLPTDTHTPEPTDTHTPEPTDTATPQATDTATPQATATSTATIDPDCGNGIPEPANGEECDDGNSVGGDGCESDCRISDACTYVPPGTPVERFVGGCGTPSFAAIQDAIGASAAGDVVSLCPGLHIESVIVDQEVTIRSTGGAAVTAVQAAGPLDPIFDIRRSGVTIEDLTLANSHRAIAVDDICPIGLTTCPTSQGSNLTIHNNVVTSNLSTGVDIRRKVDCLSITDNEVSFSGTAGVVVAAQELSSALVSIRGNTISQNPTGLDVSAAGPALLIAQNTIETANFYGVRLGEITAGASTEQLLENEIRNSATGIQVEAGGAPVRILQNNITGNTVGMRNVAPVGLVDATLNWWGSMSGPFHATERPQGLGDSVVDDLAFDSAFVEFLCAPAPSGFPSVGGSCIGGDPEDQIEFIGIGHTPDVSRTGRYIAFVSEEDINGDDRISVDNADGSEEAFLFNRKPLRRPGAYCLGGVNPGASCSSQSDCPPNLDADPIVTEGACVLITQLSHDPSGAFETGAPRLNQRGDVVFASNANLTGGNPDHSFEAVMFTHRVLRRGGVSDPNLALSEISVGSNPQDSEAPQAARSPRYTMFESMANLVGTNLDGNREIFLYDASKRRYVQITDTAGIENRRPSTQSGRQVLFDSTANFTRENDDGNREIFYAVRRRGRWQILQKTHTLPPVSNHAGASVRRGKMMVFSSDGDFTGENPDGNREVFLLARGTFQQITRTTVGENVNPVINPRARFIAFESTADADGAGDTVTNRRVFFHDVKRVATKAISRSFFGSNQNPRISEGRYVVWDSTANLTGSNPGGKRVVYCYNRRRDN